MQAHENLRCLEKPGKIGDCRQYLIDCGFSPEEEEISDLAPFEQRCPVCGLRQVKPRTTCASCGAVLENRRHSERRTQPFSSSPV